MKVVNIHEAKAHLSEYVALVEAGEPVIIARRNKPVVRLVAVDASDAPAKSGLRPVGQAKGLIRMESSFNDLLDEDLQQLFAGDSLLPGDPLNPNFRP